MGWRINFTPQAEKDLAGLGSVSARRVVTYLRERVALDPKSHAGNLKGQLREFWRLRVGNYRILGRIEDDLLLVLVVHVGHRSVIFQKNRLDQCDGQNWSLWTCSSFGVNPTSVSPGINWPWRRVF